MSKGEKMTIAQTVKKTLMYETGLDYLLKQKALWEDRLLGSALFGTSLAQAAVVGMSIDSAISGDTELAVGYLGLALAVEPLKHTGRAMDNYLTKKFSEILERTYAETQISPHDHQSQ